MKRLSFIFFLAIFFSSQTIEAQKLSLTTEEKKEFKRRAVRMIELFTESLTIIPSFETTADEGILKAKAIKNVLRLFKKDATMQLAYSSGNKSNPIPIASYLSSLTNYEVKRELVHIDIIDFNIGDIKPHPTELGKYTVQFEFVQRFSKKKNYTPLNTVVDEQFETIEWDYIDITTKGGIAIIEKTTNERGTQYVMLLGDIEANDIEIIKN